MLQFEELRLKLLGYEDKLKELKEALGLEDMKQAAAFRLSGCRCPDCHTHRYDVPADRDTFLLCCIRKTGIGRNSPGRRKNEAVYDRDLYRSDSPGGACLCILLCLAVYRNLDGMANRLDNCRRNVPVLLQEVSKRNTHEDIEKFNAAAFLAFSAATGAGVSNEFPIH